MGGAEDDCWRRSSRPANSWQSDPHRTCCSLLSASARQCCTVLSPSPLTLLPESWHSHAAGANKDAPLPVKLFEVSDVILLTGDKVGGKGVRPAAAAIVTKCVKQLGVSDVILLTRWDGQAPTASRQSPP